MAKRQAKEQKKAEKARKMAEQETMARLRDELQQYADATDSHMDVIRAEFQRPNLCTVFYVSDNPFADGNRFMAFITMVKSYHRGWRISLRHIMDQDNRFLTREEFYAMRRR